ncbi:MULTISPECIES: serine/threonine-protein kinase [Actinomadura]|uniref:Serine/threonine protein kinase n=1 Tax=Actinomadura geliboluensis TaxID=882440 RepID=A0A5S4H833_9ACTN|nr:serine/threonine-protein kinase [Actinomadura geliboluensis]TMR41159.1 serine/threonine protein kinase [Actinomadura geliboluensis]
MKPLEPGDPAQVGPYRLFGRLGRGGMGEVFLGRSPGGRLVAVKVVAADLASDADFRRRFVEEVEAARKVGGFYTAEVVDADPDAGRPWLVTAYIPGPSLQQAVAESGPLPDQAVQVLGSGLAEGLLAVHRAGLVHRDLKPGNVLLADDGPRVIDFGIARALDAAQKSTAVIGTPGFMSPEQARGRAAGPESDVFSLGCVLAYAATGEGPYGKGRPAVVVYRIIHEEPDLSRLPERLRPFVAACLAKDPAARPSVGDVLAHFAPAADEGHWLPERVSAMITERKAAVPPSGDRPPAPWTPAPPPPVTAHTRVETRPAAPRTPVWTRPRVLLPAAVGTVVLTAALTWGVIALTGGGEPGARATGGTPKPGTASQDPCDVIDQSIIRENQLISTGVQGGYQNAAENVRTCEWRTAQYGADTDFRLTLMYAPEPVRLFRTELTDAEHDKLTGLPGMRAYGSDDERACQVTWENEGSSTHVSTVATGSMSSTADMCHMAARLAVSVASKVP